MALQFARVSSSLARQSLSMLPRRFMSSDGVGFHGSALSKLNLVEVSEGKAVFEIQIGIEHLNRRGTLHGGFTAALVDETTTLAIKMADKPCGGITVDLNTTYMGVARAGDELTITAVCVKAGRNMAFATADVFNKTNGKLIAQGKQTKFIVNPTTYVDDDESSDN